MKYRGEVLTTQAPSPSTTLRAKSGTGNQEGRPNTSPSCRHNSVKRTGFGAVPLITPVKPRYLSKNREKGVLLLSFICDQRSSLRTVC